MSGEQTESTPTAVTIIKQLVEVLHRCDPEYCDAFKATPCTDEEYDAALGAAETFIEEHDGG